jgi:hypothetical protein
VRKADVFVAAFGGCVKSFQRIEMLMCKSPKLIGFSFLSSFHHYVDLSLAGDNQQVADHC